MQIIYTVGWKVLMSSNARMQENMRLLILEHQNIFFSLFTYETVLSQSKKSCMLNDAIRGSLRYAFERIAVVTKYKLKGNKLSSIKRIADN